MCLKMKYLKLGTKLYLTFVCSYSLNFVSKINVRNESKPFENGWLLLQLNCKDIHLDANNVGNLAQN